MLEQLEAEARDWGVLLRLQVGRRLGLWSLRLVVARQAASGSLRRCCHPGAAEHREWRDT